jgi:hypothetical protein
MKRDKIFLLVLFVGVTAFSWGGGEKDTGSGESVIVKSLIVDNLLDKYENNIDELSFLLKQARFEKVPDPPDDDDLDPVLLYDESVFSLVDEELAIMEELEKYLDVMSIRQLDRYEVLLERWGEYDEQLGEW